MRPRRLGNAMQSAGLKKWAMMATYCTSVDTHSGSLLNKSVKTFVAIGHDEYWSPEMRSTLRRRVIEPTSGQPRFYDRKHLFPAHSF
jgi:hypothetical protein